MAEHLLCMQLPGSVLQHLHLQLDLATGEVKDPCLRPRQRVPVSSGMGFSFTGFLGFLGGGARTSAATCCH